ncbi:MAG: MFS transporter [Spirochaetales bacterium]|nr:MFS transporter [Spirochaetales bacterium]
MGKLKNALGQTFFALKYPNYRLWFFGQLVSVFGTWMQTTAQGFLLFEITHSAAYLGYLGFASGVSTWLFMLYGGVIADRIPRRTLIMITQSMMMILALILAVLTFLNLVQPWHILILAFLLGIANSFDAPARQAFVLEMVDKDALSNAIALNSTLFNSATALGPAAGGILYMVFGPGWCFLINGVSFLAVILALFFMKIPVIKTVKLRTSAIRDLKESFAYIRHTPLIHTIIFMVGIISIFGFSLITLFPAWAVNVLHGNADTNGFLQSARGIGALAGALIIASLGNISFKGKLLAIGSLIFPLLLLIFSFIRISLLSYLVLFFLGFCMMFIFNLANILIQTSIRNELRGRVMGIYTFTFFGFMPVGTLVTGLIAEKIGESAALIINAMILFGVFLFIWIKKPVVRTHVFTKEKS